MYQVSRTGSMADAIRQVRDIPARVIPYAASTALTKSAQASQKAIVAEMSRVFDRPVQYTLNALRTVPSTVETLSARVAVKDQGGRVPQENYLLPEVEGGGRREKGMERSLRYAGILRAGEFAVPGSGAPLDANGNLSGGTVRAILRAVVAVFKKGEAVKRRRRKSGAAFSPYFFAELGRKNGKKTRGVWRRQGRDLKSVLYFTTRRPQYRGRLDFTGVAERVTLAEFPRLFAEAAQAITDRNR